MLTRTAIVPKNVKNVPPEMLAPLGELAYRYVSKKRRGKPLALADDFFTDLLAFLPFRTDHVRTAVWTKLHTRFTENLAASQEKLQKLAGDAVRDIFVARWRAQFDEAVLKRDAEEAKRLAAAAESQQAESGSQVAPNGTETDLPASSARAPESGDVPPTSDVPSSQVSTVPTGWEPILCFEWNQATDARAALIEVADCAQHLVEASEQLQYDATFCKYFLMQLVGR